ncbi:uncharacterized protein LOC116599980 [Mustela erminea]|uniref:uncharacterized protein LOC116599980 n=1 Tax=Mustela erminea TaxID=36723 RepID=UPI0013873228|nr:uncharacterized protein LOC116599980 [Mustela erminea]
MGSVSPSGVKEQRLVSWAHGQQKKAGEADLQSCCRAGITVQVLRSEAKAEPKSKLIRERETTHRALRTDSGRKEGTERATRTWSAGLGGGGGDLPWDLLHFWAQYPARAAPALDATLSLPPKPRVCGLFIIVAPRLWERRPPALGTKVTQGEGAAGSRGKHIPWEIRSEIAPNPDRPAPALRLACPLCKQGKAEPSLRRFHSHTGLGADFICGEDMDGAGELSH